MDIDKSKQIDQLNKCHWCSPIAANRNEFLWVFHDRGKSVYENDWNLPPGVVEYSVPFGVDE